MAFGGFAKGAAPAPTAEINMVPLIDVMLVLLVIFIITAPLLTHAVKIDLPKAPSRPNQIRAETIQLGIRASGAIFWNGETIGVSDLGPRMRAAARVDPQPEIHLHADSAAAYGSVAQVMSAAARAGLTKIGFVTDPTESQSP